MSHARADIVTDKGVLGLNCVAHNFCRSYAMKKRINACECKVGCFVALWPGHCPPTFLIEMCWGAVLWPEASFSLGLETNVGLSGVGVGGLVLGSFGQRPLSPHNFSTEASGASSLPGQIIACGWL